MLVWVRCDLYPVGESIIHLKTFDMFDKTEDCRHLSILEETYRNGYSVVVYYGKRRLRYSISMLKEGGPPSWLTR